MRRLRYHITIRNLLVMLPVLMAGCAGPARHSSDQGHPAWMAEARQQHAQKEIASIREAPAQMAQAPEHAPAPLGRPLTLEAAIAYALAHNLDAAVKQLESDIQNEAVVGARLKMLPSLTLTGELSQRNNYDASYSEPLFEQGAQDYNYSREKDTKRYNAELSWDLLNFGLAYYQQRQAGYQYRISDQQRRRVIQNLKFDVAKTYWQLLAAKRSMDLAAGVVRRLEERERVLQKQVSSQTTSELEALATAVALSEMRMNMSGLAHEYRLHTSTLASLMGLPAHTVFETPDLSQIPSLEDAPMDIAMLETEALRQRPELFEQDMQERIAKDEARIAIARTMPRTSIFYRYSHDDDTHLYENDWHEMGVRLTMDLLSVPQQISQKREAVLKQSLAQTRRQSMAAAIVTQLRIAVIDFEDSRRKYRHSEEIAVKRQLLLDARRRHAALGNSSYEEVIESEAQYLLARVRNLAARAEVLIAEQRILNSVGSEDIGKNRFVLEGRPFKAKRSVAVLPPSSRENTSAIFALQLSSWQSEAEALARLSEYQRKGLNPYVQKADIAGLGVRWRCYAGQYRSADEAKTAKATHGLTQALVVQRSNAVQ